MGNGKNVEDAAKDADNVTTEGKDAGDPSSCAEGKNYKRLSKGEIKKLQDAGIDPHDLKPKKGGSRYDLFKDENGDISVMNKDGSGEAEPTGYNINNLEE